VVPCVRFIIDMEYLSQKKFYEGFQNKWTIQNITNAIIILDNGIDVHDGMHVACYREK